MSYWLFTYYFLRILMIYLGFTCLSYVLRRIHAAYLWFTYPTHDLLILFIIYLWFTFATFILLVLLINYLRITFSTYDVLITVIVYLSCLLFNSDTCLYCSHESNTYNTERTHTYIIPTDDYRYMQIHANTFTIPTD